MTKNEVYRNMIYYLHMNAKDKRYTESKRQFFSEMEQCLKDCDEERRKYKQELDELKKTLKKLVDIALTIE